MKALCLATALVLAGCAAFDAPQAEVVVSAGNSICLGDTPSECEALYQTARSLHSQEMTDAICDAGADTIACTRRIPAGFPSRNLAVRPRWMGR